MPSGSDAGPRRAGGCPAASRRGRSWRQPLPGRKAFMSSGSSVGGSRRTPPLSPPRPAPPPRG
eukprot:12507544-Alexandrium_andersonii.AAC.1